MISDNALSILADLYNPALCIGILLVMFRLRRWRSIGRATALLGLYWLGAFGISLLDYLFPLWSRIGWDYSTHTAFAAACVWFLWRYRQQAALWILSLLVYFWLMRHLRYHTIADMASTLAVMLLWLQLADVLLKMFKNGNSNSSQIPKYERNPNSDHQS